MSWDPEAPDDMSAHESIHRDQRIVGRPIQYGVRLNRRGSPPTVHGWRWRNWDDAAEFGQIEVLEGRAIGFWVFCEPSE